MGVLDLVGKAATKGAKKAAPFFSKADVVLDELPRGKGLGNEFLGELVKKGAKPTELRERGIEKALKDKPKMTKAEVQKVFESNPPPRVQEKVLSSDVPDYDEWLENKAQEIYGVDWFELRKDEKAALDKMYGALDLTQYDRYKTPGGENYREILLKLPEKKNTQPPPDTSKWQVITKRTSSIDGSRDLQILDEQNNSIGQRLGFQGSNSDAIRQVLPAFLDWKARTQDQVNFQSSHYKTDPNLLAHIRVQDFKTPEGKKVLLVDEIQSDWHQEARDLRRKEIKRIMDETGVDKKTATAQVPEDFGYASENRPIRMSGEVIDLGDRTYGVKWQDGSVSGVGMGLSHAQRLAEAGKLTGVVPDAPFKKNWHELAMKRVLDYAAENGYDSIAITPGAEQAKRYDLSKHLNEINYGKNPDGTFSLTAVDKRGKPALNESSLSEEQLQDTVGKDLAQRIIAGEGNDFPVGSVSEGKKSLSGLDLVVGGEGKQVLYDTMLPKYLNTLGSQYGTSVGQMDLPLGYTEESKRLINDAYARGSRADIDLATQQAQMQTLPVHRFDITPQFRDEVKNKGLPLYSKTGMGPEGLAAGSGAATIGSQMFDENNEQQVQNPVHFTENPDAMLLELMQRN